MGRLLDYLRRGDRRHRNDTLMDWWSWGHFVFGIFLGWVMDPFWALVLMIAYEPIEIFVISPLMWRFLRIEFGYETLRNSLSDILFDTAGVAAGHFLLTRLVAPPFHWG